MSLSPTIVLNDGHAIPRLGFGVWRLPDEDAPGVVGAAIKTGYRHIDTAQGYSNEAGVGRAVREAQVPRGELFVTSKERTGDQGYDSTLRSFEGSLKRLGLEYLDLFLIHWPVPQHDRYAETWKALVALQAQGQVRSIGVSNFLPSHIERIIGETGVAPAVNQVELHPSYQQRDARAWHAAHGIVTESYSPLGGDGAAVLREPVVADIAARLDKTPAQVVVRWHLQQDLVVLPKTSSPARAAENLDVWDFSLSAEDMAQIDALDRPDGKTLPPPDEMNNLF
jgi:2,5-diketo-D-gluconate reductase A